MKTLFQILFVLCLPLMGMAQGNLQFNQAKFLQYDTTFQLVQGGQMRPVILNKTIVVATGKVLKIESVSASNSASNIGYYLYLNNVPFEATGGYNYISLPIWLPSGSYTFKFYNGGNSISSWDATQNTWYRISGIEFNIIP
jgi:hypothetical protein